MRDPDGHGTAATGGIGLSLHNGSVSYRGMTLFTGLDLTLSAGTWTALLGPSGVGKSSLLKLLAGLITPGPETRIEAGDGQAVRPRIAYMGQQDLLMPWLDLLDNVTLGYRLRGA